MIEPGNELLWRQAFSENVVIDRKHFVTYGNCRIDSFFAARHCSNHKKARYQHAQIDSA
jgi:hypothetical protein